jgi:hypothetical protein
MSSEIRGHAEEEYLPRKSTSRAECERTGTANNPLLVGRPLPRQRGEDGYEDSKRSRSISG